MIALRVCDGARDGREGPQHQRRAAAYRRPSHQQHRSGRPRRKTEQHRKRRCRRAAQRSRKPQGVRRAWCVPRQRNEHREHERVHHEPRQLEAPQKILDLRERVEQHTRGEKRQRCPFGAALAHEQAQHAQLAQRDQEDGEQRFNARVPPAECGKSERERGGDDAAMGVLLRPHLRGLQVPGVRRDHQRGPQPLVVDRDVRDRARDEERRQQRQDERQRVHDARSSCQFREGQWALLRAVLNR